MYIDIHTSITNEISIDCTNIRCFKNTLYTVQTRKRVLSKLDRKRWWANPDGQSLRFSHPDVPLILDCKNQRNPKREREQTLDDLHTDLAYNKTKRRCNF